MNPTSNTELDYLIVGQGLAGSLLAYFLLCENQRVKVMDFPHPGTSSKVAAGVINPVTGRRMAKSWRFEEFLPFARKTYRELEELLGIEIWRERNILRALHNQFELNEWERRGAFPEFEPYFIPETDTINIDDKIRKPFSWGELQQSAQVAMPEFVTAYKKWLEGKDLFISENVDYQKISTSEGGVQYDGFKAKKIIFCEGYRALQNPYFNHLPFVVTKGELLILRIPGANFNKMIKHKIFLVPISGMPGTLNSGETDLYWAGSTSRWEFDGPEPSPEQRAWLIRQIEEVLEVPYEVVGHHAGIRPTVQDIRPFLGLHPDLPHLGIFNGLGTKGATLGPFFAKQMTGFLLGINKLDSDVDISRFTEAVTPASAGTS